MSWNCREHGGSCPLRLLVSLRHDCSPVPSVQLTKHWSHGRQAGRKRVSPFINASCDLFFLVPPSFGCRERNLWGCEGKKGDRLHQHCPSPKGDLISLPVLLYFCRGVSRGHQCPCVEAMPLTYGMLKPAPLSLGAPTLSAPSELRVREATLVSWASVLVGILTPWKLVSSETPPSPCQRASCWTLTGTPLRVTCPVVGGHHT